VSDERVRSCARRDRTAGRSVGQGRSLGGVGRSAVDSDLRRRRSALGAALVTSASHFPNRFPKRVGSRCHHVTRPSLGQRHPGTSDHGMTPEDSRCHVRDQVEASGLCGPCRFKSCLRHQLAAGTQKPGEHVSPPGCPHSSDIPASGIRTGRASAPSSSASPRSTASGSCLPPRGRSGARRRMGLR
jgi:hypothetical protein